MEQKKPEATPVQGDEVVGAGIFDDEVMRRTVLEDPLAKFVNKNWLQIIGVLIVVAVVYFGYVQFMSAYQTRMSGAADLYRKVREEYAALTETRASAVKETDAKKKEELTKSTQESSRKLSESIRALGDASYPYSEIARIYQALVLITVPPGGALTADVKAARQVLQPLNWEQEKTGSPKRLLAELRALLLGRTLLDDPSTIAEGRSMLKTLAQRGAVVHTAAALSLSQIASTDEEKKEAKAVLESLRSQHVEQGEVIDSELQRY